MARSSSTDVHAKRRIAYVIDPDAEERKWIEGVLSQTAEVVSGFDDAEALPVLVAQREGCIVIAVEPDEMATLELVRKLRRSGKLVPVIVVGPRTAFRTATDIARLGFTDFLERPLSAYKLRAAIERVSQHQS